MPTPLFITVAAYPDAVQAETARVLLEDSGIPAYIRDNNTVSIMPWYTIALGNVRVDVASTDLAAAKAILANMLIPLNSPSNSDEDLSELAEAAYMTGVEPAENSPLAHDFADDLACPRCATSSSLEGMSWTRAIAVTLMPFIKPVARCPKCGHRWQVRPPITRH